MGIYACILQGLHLLLIFSEFSIASFILGQNENSSYCHKMHINKIFKVKLTCCEKLVLNEGKLNSGHKKWVFMYFHYKVNVCNLFSVPFDLECCAVCIFAEYVLSQFCTQQFCI